MSLKERKYDSAKEIIEQHFIYFPFKKVGLDTKDLSDQVYSHCDQKYKVHVKTYSEFLYCFTPEHDFMLNLYLPQILLCIRYHQRMTAALESDPSTLEEVAKDIWEHKMADQSSLLNANYMIKLQEVAPHYVSELAGQETQAYTSSEV